MKSILFIAVTAFALHLVWETLHLPLYANYAGLGGPLPVQMYATLGDVLYTFLIIGVISLYKRGISWLTNPSRGDYLALALLGLAVAIFVEYKAQVLHSWTYSPLMPTLFGIGLDPLLQMAILLPLSVYLARIAAASI